MAELPIVVDTNKNLPWCILASSSEGICLVEAASGQIAWHNPAFARACNNPSALLGTTINSLFPNWPEFEVCESTFGSEWNFRISSVDEWNCIYALRSATPRTERSTDVITGLADRFQFEQRIRSAWDNYHSSNGPPFALLFIDLDHFKRINDTWGHLVGDEALRQVTERLKSAFRTDDFLARYGGDEFVALLPGFRMPNGASHFIQRINDALRKPIKVEECEVAVSASVGVAWSSDGYSTPEELLNAADRAMYASKENQ